jgi:hypothetical protein
VLLAATPAHAISFNFSFQVVNGGTNGFVTGTLSGLVEGNNAGPGITATVTSSPRSGVASDYSFLETNGGQAFTVTNGNITFADVQFQSLTTAADLYLGTQNNNAFGFYNELSGVDGGNFFRYLDVNNTTKFTAATPVPFEPNPAVGGAILGFCFGAAKLRRNHLAKKRMVSLEA